MEQTDVQVTKEMVKEKVQRDKNKYRLAWHQYGLIY